MTAHPYTRPYSENPVFDTRLIAYVFNQRGYRVNEFAGLLDMSNDTVEAFLRGDIEVGDLRMATLLAMANLLGIPLYSMFAQPPTPPDPSELDGADGSHGRNENASSDSTNTSTDAAQLIAAIYDSGRTTTLISELALAFGWTTDRVYTAATEATRRLAPAGLRAATSHGEIHVAPTDDHRIAHEALTQRKTYERGLTVTHYKAVHQMYSGREVTVTNSARQRLLALGGLVNLGIVTDARRPSLSDQASDAFL